MSRIGYKTLKIEDGVEVTLNGNIVTVKGALGEMSLTISDSLKVEIVDGEVKVSRESEEKKVKSLHGTTRMLIANAVHGVKHGFEKKLEIVGVGYRVKSEGNGISLSLGLNHPVIFQPYEGTQLLVEGETMITVKGFDKQKVGELAAKIREVKKPEPYKGKGIRYLGEYVRRKSAKSAAK